MILKIKNPPRQFLPPEKGGTFYIEIILNFREGSNKVYSSRFFYQNIWKLLLYLLCLHRWMELSISIFSDNPEIGCKDRHRIVGSNRTEVSPVPTKDLNSTRGPIT